MGATKIPSECLWHERWPIWGYIGAEFAQSGFQLGIDRVMCFPLDIFTLGFIPHDFLLIFWNYVMYRYVINIITKVLLQFLFGLPPTHVFFLFYVFCFIISPDESRGYIGFRSVAPPPSKFPCGRDNSKTD